MTTGKQVYELAQKHKGEKYVFGALAPKSDANYKGPWDCAELVAWTIYQLTHLLYGCAKNDGKPDTADSYTGFFDRDAKELGTIISVNDAYSTPGALLLRVAGNGQVGHIVICRGDGTTIEAHSTKTGVINSVVTGRRWDYGILIPWITYTKIEIPDIKDRNQKPVEKIYRYTKPLMKDPVIGKIQAALKFPPSDIDNIYGTQTYDAVRAFQLQKGLVPDGEVGPNTLAALGISVS